MSTDFIDELLARTDVVELIREYVPLTQKGGRFWACCPFHNEKTSSFSIDSGKQLWYCFGSCQEGGNAITFIKKIENVESGDAIRILAKKAGMEVPQDTNFNKSSGMSEEKKERLYTLMRLVAKFYHENLYSARGQKFKKYLSDRGISDSIIKRFGIGASLDGNSAIDFLIKQDFTLEELKEANQAQVSEKGAYDPFYDRLMIPIINQFGEVCAFGGRTLEKDPDFAKYRNSTNTPIFVKNKTVFGANLLQKLKKDKVAIDFVILCEGYMDVIALHSAGFNTATASMGTALSLNQAKQIRNFTNKVYISFDGDTAGQKNALAGLDVLAGAGLTVRVVQMPVGLDPDDVVKKYGADGYQKLLDKAITLPEFKIKKLLEKFNLEDLEGKAKFTAEAIAVIKRIENEIEQEEYFRRISSLTGYGIDVLRRQADKTVLAPLVVEERQANNIKEQNKSRIDKVYKAKAFILASLIAKKSFVDYTEDYDFILDDEFSKTVARFFIANNKDKKESVDGILYARVDDEQKVELDYLLNKYQFVDGDDATKYNDCIKSLKENVLQKRSKQLEFEYQRTKDISVLKEMREIQEEIRELK